MFLRIVLPLALAAGAVAAAAPQSNAGRAAGRFTLDMPAPEASVTPSAEASPAATLPPASVPESAAVTSSSPAQSADAAPLDDTLPGARAAYTLDTPIHDLIANPATKAVLDRDLPGLSDDENLAKFDRLGLKAFQPMTGGQLTDAMLAKVAKDLAATGGAPLAAPVKSAGDRRSRDDSR